jgi:glycosyltransferase involved in cell wall biosynthesis
MRVLHVSAGRFYGGVETLLATLARCRELCPSMRPEFAVCFKGRLSEELIASGAPVHVLGAVRIRKPLAVWRARRKLKEVLRRGLFDLVICHSAWPLAVLGPVVRGARRPLVFWQHDAIDGRHWIERWARLTTPDMAISNSLFTAATISRLYPCVRDAIVYCPVAPPERAIGSTTHFAVRAELNTPADAIVIIQAGRMEAWKGHALHLEALGRLRDLPGWECWQVGGAQRSHEMRYLESLREKASRLRIAERVRFLGQRSDVRQLMAAADIHCQPNTGPEPFGIAFIEALYAQLPVVATAIGGAKEIVDDSCGILVAPDDPDGLAAALRRLIEKRELRLRLGAGGAGRAKKLCDPVTQMGRLSKLLAPLAGCKAQDGPLASLSVAT